MSGPDTRDPRDRNTLADVAPGVWQKPPATGPTTTTAQASGRRRAQARALAAHSAFAQLRGLAATTHVVGAALGLAADDLAASEDFDHVERFCSLAIAQALALSQREARAWFATLGDDLELALALEGLDSAFDPVSAELRAEHDPAAALAAFQAQAQEVAATQGESVSVTARLRIGKAQAQRLAAQALAERATATTAGEVAAPEAALVFYSAAACERLLTLRAAPDWAQWGLGGERQRLCVVLCDASGALTGLALEVIGAADAETSDEQWLPVSRAAWRRFAQRAQAQRALRQAESAWSGLSLPWLPDHLRVTARGVDDRGLARLAERLQALRTQVAACVMASHVERNASGASGQGDVTLRFAGTRPALAQFSSAAPPSDLEAAPCDALIALADWAYRDASPDKLAIARQALAATLTPGATPTLAQLCSAADDALGVARANFAIYLRGATERYFQLRAAAQGAVGGFAAATRAAVTSLTSDVTDNLFRTVGLIVGVFIAWLIQPSASFTLAHIAAALYTGYVGFIVLYLLRARWARYLLERKALDDTLAAMPELTQAERDRLRQPARDAEAHFARYYTLTQRIYLALVALGALVFLLMFLPQAQALVPHALSAATPTPRR